MVAPDGTARGVPSDGQTAASLSLAWLIAANKPLYPLYIWWVTGHVWAGVASALTGLLYLALPFLARANGAWVRLGVPVLGSIDTVLAMKLFGPVCGGEFYIVPCLLLAGVALHLSEWRWAVGLALVAFAVSVLLHGRMGAPVFDWSAEQAAGLFMLNLYSAAALSVFIIWRFSGVAKA